MAVRPAGRHNSAIAASSGAFVGSVFAREAEKVTVLFALIRKKSGGGRQEQHRNFPALCIVYP